jgi:hypothetical protein
MFESLHEPPCGWIDDEHLLEAFRHHERESSDTKVPSHEKLLNHLDTIDIARLQRIRDAWDRQRPDDCVSTLQQTLERIIEMGFRAAEHEIRDAEERYAQRDESDIPF